jgi:hypothetical protein
MRWVRHIVGMEMRNAYKVLVGKRDAKRPTEGQKVLDRRIILKLISKE